MVPSSCAEEKLIELLKKSFASAFFVDHALPFCPPDLSLGRVLMESAKDILDSRS